LVPEQARLPVAFGFPFGRRFSIQKPIKTNKDKEKHVFICFVRLPVFVGFSLFLLVFEKTRSVQPTVPFIIFPLKQRLGGTIADNHLIFYCREIILQCREPLS